MHEAALAKIADRTAPGDDAERLRPRAVAAACGSPGLLELLTRAIAQEPDRAKQLLGEMEAFLQRKGPLTDRELVTYLTDLALDRLVALLNSGERMLLRTLRVFDQPLPLRVLEHLEERPGGLDRLLGLGLADRADDPVDPATEAGRLADLLRARTDLAPDLLQGEMKAVATVVTGPLFEAWGGAAAPQRPPTADLQLLDLALLSGEATVAAACGADALGWLHRASVYREAGRRAAQTIDLVDDKKVEPGIHLLRNAADSLFRAGDVNRARPLLECAAAMLASGAADLPPALAGGVHLSLGRLRSQSGEIEAATASFRAAINIFSKAGLERDHAIATGEIAAILSGQGQLDEALRLHREERLPVYERLGDVRERSATQWAIAAIHLQRGELDEAAPLMAEAYAAADRLKALDGIAAIGVVLGQLIFMDGQREEGLAILRRSEAGFRQLRQPGEAGQVAQLIREIEGQGGDR
jgi:tetratricopeptide (TPR) repeat protein